MTTFRSEIPTGTLYEFEFQPDPSAYDDEQPGQAPRIVEEDAQRLVWEFTNFTGRLVARRLDPASYIDGKETKEGDLIDRDVKNSSSPTKESSMLPVHYTMDADSALGGPLSPVSEEATVSPPISPADIESQSHDNVETGPSMPFLLDPLHGVTSNDADDEDDDEEVSSNDEPNVYVDGDPAELVSPASTTDDDDDSKAVPLAELQDIDLHALETMLEDDDDDQEGLRSLTSPESAMSLDVISEDNLSALSDTEDSPKPPKLLGAIKKATASDASRKRSLEEKLQATTNIATARLSRSSMSSMSTNRSKSADTKKSDRSGKRRLGSKATHLAKDTGGALKRALKKVTTKHSSKDDTEDEDEENDNRSGSTKQRKRESAVSRWGMLINVNNMKKNIPSNVRQKRAERRSNASGPLLGYHAPTKLHELCADPQVTLEDLHNELVRSPESASVKDDKGRLPLHILGDNDGLVSETLGKATAKTFAWQLMKAYPDAITTIDDDGYMPFVCLLRDWQTWIYETHLKSKKDSTPTNRFFPTAALPLPAIGSKNDEDDELVTTTTEAYTQATEIPKVVTNASTRSFPRVEMWQEVEWCFEMLSMAMDELGGKDGGLHKVSRRDMHLEHFNQRDFDARNDLVTHVVETVPTILKSVLLMEEEGGATRKRLLKTSLVRRMLLCPESIGDWLTTMLRKKGVPSKRAIDYLELVSQVTVEDFVGCYRPATEQDVIAFQDTWEKVISALDDLDGTVASLVVLDDKETERAAATPVVWHIMNKNLARSFVVSLVLIDFVLHITLMLAFRTDVSPKYFISRSSIGEVPTQVVYFICCHYLIRKASESIALLNISMSVFKGYFMSLWTIFDVIAIFMTLTAISWNNANPYRYRQGFNAFVLGLLWVKVLGFLKVVNKQMATFILALIQILFDLRYFMVVLLVIIFMFADMMRIAISTKDDGGFCLEKAQDGELEGPLLDFCSTTVANSYLRVYALLLGDFELNDYKETQAMMILFVFFTLFGVVILLNVLIAVISDSYEKAKISSMLLFGRARVSFVAQNQALESFLRPGTNPMAALKLATTPSNCFVAAGRLLRWCVLLSLVVTAMSAEVYLAAQSIQFIKFHKSFFNVIFMLTIVVVLTCALWVLLYCTLGELMRTVLPNWLGHMFDVIDRCTDYLVKGVATQVFGLNDRTTRTASGEDDEEEEWVGRATHMERAIEKSIGEATEEIKEEIVELEKRLHEHEELKQQKAGQSERAKSLWKTATKKALLSKAREMKKSQEETEEEET